jgi:hypothetical protein
VTIEFRRLPALDFGKAGLVTALVENPRGIFKDIRTFGQIIDEEMTGGITRIFIVG